MKDIDDFIKLGDTAKVQNNIDALYCLYMQLISLKATEAFMKGKEAES